MSKGNEFIVNCGAIGAIASKIVDPFDNSVVERVCFKRWFRGMLLHRRIRTFPNNLFVHIGIGISFRVKAHYLLVLVEL